MKKLIAISVVFALVLGAAYAQPNIGGNFKVGTNLLKGQSANSIDVGNKAGAGPTEIFDGYITANFGDADAGGLVRFYGGAGHQPVFMFAWWKPMEFLRLQMGVNPDGDWGHAQITGWGWNSEAQGANVAADEWRSLSGSGWATLAIGARSMDIQGLTKGPGQFAPGFNALGITLTLNPIDALQIGVGIKYPDASAWQDIYTRLYIDVKFALPDIGTLRLAAQLAPGNNNRHVDNKAQINGSEEPYFNWKGNAESHDPTTVWAAFHLTAIENLGVEIGVGYRLPYTTQDAKFVPDFIGTDGKVDTAKVAKNAQVNVGGEGVGKAGDADYLPVNTKVRSPASLGIGAQFNADAIAVKLRAGLSFAGSTEVDGKNKSYASNIEAYKAAGFDTSYIPQHLFLLSDVYYEQYTRTVDSVAVTYEGKQVATKYSEDHWVARSGTQMKKRDPIYWALNVKPSIKVKDFTIFLNAGVGMKHYLSQEVTTRKVASDGSDYESWEYARLGAIISSTETTSADKLAAAAQILAYSKAPDSFWEETVTFKGAPGLYSKERTLDIPTNVGAQTKLQLDAYNNAVATGTADEQKAAYNAYLAAYQASEAAYYADMTDLVSNFKTRKLDFDWYVNPYVQIPAGGGQFYAGVKIITDGTKIPVKFNYNAANSTNQTNAMKPGAGYKNIPSTLNQVKWSIPIGFNFYF